MGSFKRRLALAVALVVLGGGAGFLAYQLTAFAKDTAKPTGASTAPAGPIKPEPPKQDKPALWGKICQPTDGKQLCMMVQNVVITDKNTNASLRALSAAVGYQPTDGKLRLILTMPLGLALQSGVGFQIDEAQASTLPVETCLADGCRIAMAIDDSGRDSLVKAKMIKVSYQLANGHKLVLPIELAGFGDALAELKP